MSEYCVHCEHELCLQTEDCPGGRHYERQMARLGDTIPSQSERAGEAYLAALGEHIDRMNRHAFERLLLGAPLLCATAEPVTEAERAFLLEHVPELVGLCPEGDPLGS